MTQEEASARLKKQLSDLVERFSEMEERLSKAEMREGQLLAQVSALQAENQALQEQVAVAHHRIEELEKQKTPPPAFVKANVKKRAAEEKQPRKKRDAQYNHARRREAPTQVVEHRIKHCPVCANALGGISVARRRKAHRVASAPASRGDGARGVPRLVQRLWHLARSCTGCESAGSGTGTLRGEDWQSDCLFAHGDALAGAPVSSLSGQLAWPVDQ
ncbi:MAG TPA: hypothetical protein VEH81_08090 [Ktedonobacteraceae bacterium]|nr:hypothetical protein [Ktedonobacteraceae bacterium]